MLGDLELPAVDAIIAGRYRIDASLGKGGMGVVYRAEDLIVGEPVALKVLLSSDGKALERFRSELLLARRVTHPNVGRTYDMGVDGKLHFLTMELVGGDSLRGLLRSSGPLPISDIGHYLSQVASGLAAAHAARVVHRDLKPSNVLVTCEGRVVVIDFGVASMAEGGRAAEGTLDYMSPEQLEGAPAAPSHDVFSLGCVAFELATGLFPFPGEAPIERARARLELRPRLEELESPRLREIVAACLARRPEDRPKAEDLVARFAALENPASARVAVVPAPNVEAPTKPAPFAAAPTLVIARFEQRAISAPLDLGAAVAEEITDVLSMTKGLRVLATNVAEDIDWKDLSSWARTKTVDYVVGGKIEQLAGGSARITLRLVEAKSGAQLLASQLEAGSGGLAGIASNIAMRVAEALRLELEVIAHEPIPDEAALAFLEGRRLLRAGETPLLALHALDRCLSSTPSFAPAVAARAVALARAFHLGDDTFNDWSKELPAAEARALELAPLLPDTHLAIGIHALNEMRFADGLRALYRAVELAPTHALAHEIIGRVECEAGQASRGMERLELAITLDPKLHASLHQVARAHALRGHLDTFNATIARLSATGRPALAETLMLLARVALWYRDAERAKEVLATLDQQSHGKGSMREYAFRIIRDVAALVAGSSSIQVLRATEPVRFSLPLSTRLRSTMLQVCADYEAAYGDPERALVNLELSVSQGLMDIEWLSRSPALDRIRHEPELTRAEEEVTRRVAELWTQRLAPGLSVLPPALP